jgi:hypothetical protein
LFGTPPKTSAVRSVGVVPQITKKKTPAKTPVQEVKELTSGIPLGAHIPKRIKEKIWANEYIDLSIICLYIIMRSRMCAFFHILVS